MKATPLLGVFILMLCSCASNEKEMSLGENDALYVGEDGLLYNKRGEEVVLRGVNLGSWMLQESWMSPVTGGDRQWANLDTIRAMEERGWTASQIQELFDTYQDNWITEDDFNFFQELGINSIRLPFWYRNFMSDEKGTWINNDDGSDPVTRNPGFLRLDWAIEQAASRGIYVILDLHGAVGGQSMDHSTGTLKKNELYTNPVCENATVELWKAIARRYKNSPAVAAYDLLNEPQNNGGYTGENAWPAGSQEAIWQTVRIYDRLYREIREIDPDTIIIMEAIWSMNLPDPMAAGDDLIYFIRDDSGRFVQRDIRGAKTALWDKNLMYSMHIYDRSFDTGDPPRPGGTVDFRVWELLEARRKWRVAIHVGEFNNDSPNVPSGFSNLQSYAYRLYNDNKINWNMWTYKLAGANMGSWSIFQSARKEKANPVTDSYEELKEKWGETLRTFKTGTNILDNGFVRTVMFPFVESALGE